MPARILVVDDTPANVKLIAARLAGDYYQVTAATGGQEALDKIAAESPDLILLDIQMPDMDGFEVCRRLKADPATADIPVVILTALSDASDRVRGLTLGADDFLTKPINQLALMARIRSLLRAKLLMDEWRLREATAAQFDGIAVGAAEFAASGSCLVTVGCTNSDTASIGRQLDAHGIRTVAIGPAGDVPTDAAADVFVVELGQPGTASDGLAACSALRSNPALRQTPILLLADTGAMDRVARGLDMGANDYLTRPIEPEELFARVRTQLRYKRGFDRLREGFKATLQAALVDPLTRAFNRRYLDAHLPRHLAQSAESGKDLSVQVIDIDHFKAINDRHMHAGGDAVLREVAARIMAHIRPSDFFVRLGGEEFAVVMPDTPAADAAKVARRLHQVIATTAIEIAGEPGPVAVTVSIGVATLPGAQAGAADAGPALFARADAALYRAKADGRNRIETD